MMPCAHNEYTTHSKKRKKNKKFDSFGASSQLQLTAKGIAGERSEKKYPKNQEIDGQNKGI